MANVGYARVWSRAPAGVKKSADIFQPVCSPIPEILPMLELGLTKVTNAGVQNLQKTLPSCTIFH